MEYAVKVHHASRPNGEELHCMIPAFYDEEGNEESPYFAFNAENGHTVHLDITSGQADLLRATPGYEVASVAARKAAQTRAEEGGDSE
jgi:hypothetical protein